MDEEEIRLKARRQFLEMIRPINEQIIDFLIDERLNHLYNELGKHHQRSVEYFNRKAVEKWENLKEDFKREFNKNLEIELKRLKLI